ncbi:MAG: hypothetical protein IH951_11715 [Bacteroidetes bacterium]|nr:hypothetical protein [Bacteroidota bacterium]
METTATEKREMCFYVPGSTSIVDVVRNQKGAYSGNTLAEVQERYAGAELVPLDDACKAIDAANVLIYEVGKAKEIDVDRWEYALGVLPPKQWHRAGGWESFKISELTAGDITACYVRIGSRYFEVYGRVSTPPEMLKAWCELAQARREYSAGYGEA